MVNQEPLGGDPGNWGQSMANLAELLLACLDAAGAKSVLEIGAYEGDLTSVLAKWASGVGARVVAVDPTPHPRLIEASERHPELDLVRLPSLEALPGLPPPDAVIVDGDHNYHTVSEELRLIETGAPEGRLPLVLLHDVGWPLGRRDGYWDPDAVPPDRRQPIVARPHLLPGEPGTVEEGLPMYSAAAREGGERNGVLTAIEDHVDGRRDLRLAIVPGFFGLAVLWRRDAPWAEAVAAAIEPWDRNPVLERLEANRMFQLATKHANGLRLMRTQARLKRQRRENEDLRRLVAEQRAELERLGSPATSDPA